MNHSGDGHLRGMLLISAGAFVLLLLLGLTLVQALTVAALLACPLMIVGMAFGGQGHRGEGHGEADARVPLGDEHSYRFHR